MNNLKTFETFESKSYTNIQLLGDEALVEQFEQAIQINNSDEKDRFDLQFTYQELKSELVRRLNSISISYED